MPTVNKLERIVLAVDFSAASLAAARWTGTHLAPEAELALVHCLELPARGSVLWDALPPRDELEPRLLGDARDRLQALAAELGDGRAQVHVRTGHPSEEVASFASEWGADLVVTGRHGGRHGVPHVLGSTAEQIIASCHRPVLLARGLPGAAPRTLLVPVDESQAAGRALEWAAVLSRRHQARLVAYHAVTDWYYQRVRELDDEAEARKAQDAVEARAHAWLESFVTQHAPGAEVTPHLDTGRPAFQSLAAIERFHADLVVVGSHGLKSLIGDPLSRLSRFLLLAAPCSVFVVPEEGRGEETRG